MRGTNRFALLMAACILICVNAKAADILLVGADPQDRLDVMRGRVLNGASLGGFTFGNVVTFDGRSATPDLTTLLNYKAVVVWSDAGMFNPTNLGNNLADFVDGGGNVIVMSFGGAFGIAGRWITGGYDPLMNAGYGGQNVGTMTTIYNPASPIFTGVNSIQAEYIQSGTVRPGATLLASWNDVFQSGSPTPMVLLSGGLTGNVMNLNFYGGYPYPNTHGDIDRLIANSLNYITVPEPSTCALAAIATGVLTALARRRHARNI